MSKLTFEQELFCLAQYKANKLLGSMVHHTPWPTEAKTQERVNNLRDTYLEFYKEAEKLRQIESMLPIEIRLRLNELELLYKEARRIASDFIGHPFDEEDSRMIENATPLQAIKALEMRLKEALGEINKCHV